MGGIAGQRMRVREERGACLGEAEVAELDEALAVDEDVLRLQVAVHDGVVVQVLQRQHYARDVEARQALIHPFQHLHLNHGASEFPSHAVSRAWRRMPRKSATWQLAVQLRQ